MSAIPDQVTLNRAALIVGALLLGIISPLDPAWARSETSGALRQNYGRIRDPRRDAPGGAVARFACGRPLIVTYNPHGAPGDIEPELRRAVGALGTALHRAVSYRGNTGARAVFDVSGGHVQTVLVRWVSTPRQLAAVGPADTIATGTAMRSGRRLLAGEVVLAASALPAPAARPGLLELVLRHELAHAVGVGHHSADQRDVLFPAFLRNKSSVWGPGDRVALAAVGCRPH